MTRNLSQMTYAPFQPGQEGPTVLTLHRYNEFADGMRELGLAVNPTGRVVGLQSTKGVYVGRNIVGYTWYLGPQLRPSPVHFGDSLAELERFLWDEVDRQHPGPARLPFLVGDEQGAIMALSMAAVAPDLLSGVIAINAALPLVPGWEPPLAPLNGLPFLLVNPLDHSMGDARVLTGSELAAQLEEWGGSVTTLLGEEGSGIVSVEQVAEWMARQPVGEKSLPAE
jgi:predicted esterase